MEALDNVKYEKFCIEYVKSYGRRIEAYCVAFGLDESDEKVRRSASVQAGRLLTYDNILARIDTLVSENFNLNDEFIDLQMLKTASQDEDKNAKMKAVDIYNKLKRRYDNTIKVDVNNFNVDFD